MKISYMDSVLFISEKDLKHTKIIIKNGCYIYRDFKRTFTSFEQKSYTQLLQYSKTIKC